MKSKMILLVLSIVAVVMSALPAVASAGEWEISTPGESFTMQSSNSDALTVDGGGSFSRVTCTSTTGSGHYAMGSKTTLEEVTVTYHGCTMASGLITCTTAGQPAGTIKTTDLTGHNIMIHGTSPGPAKAGILLTPNGTHFETFTCGGVVVEVTGNGVIGEVEELCNTHAKTFKLNYESSAEGTQKYMQITTQGTKFDLDTKEASNAAKTASWDATDEIVFINAQTINCP